MIQINSTKYTFSGHETFQCKGLWLKKGFDFVKAEKSFNDESAVIELGVGKNMVSSIRYWMKAFYILDYEGNITDSGEFVFGEKGVDPFLEDVNTLWLLHYWLVSTRYATLYYELFAKYHKDKLNFTKENVFNYIKRESDDKKFKGFVFNENTVNKDIATLLKMYVTPEGKNVDDYSALLLGLNLIKKIGKDKYEFNTKTRADIHPLIFLYAIIDVADGSHVVEYDRLQFLSRVFCLTQSEMIDLFEKIHMIYPNVSYDNAAGEQLFTINEDLTKSQVLEKYYSQK